ncbi:unnamed protein product [Ilex paraguariensis]|uniref:Uncharacterized protein n=1 Tax=Ilex paraguariensis TaxID=185542 RepID=A0ABC8UMT4_9AQUA
MDESQKPPVPGGPSLIKLLASCNTTIRQRSLKLITSTWLPSQPQLSDHDMKKLWKGLFYCMWHADKAQSQSELVTRLSSLILNLDLRLSLHYFSTFLLTMRREWPGIDHLRLDKFYLLIRSFVRSIFGLFKKNNWDLELLRAVMSILKDKAFLADDKVMGNGVNYHIVSVFLDEFRPFLPVKLEMVEILLEPFFAVMGKSQDKIFVGKVKSNVFDVLLKTGRSLLGRKKSGLDGDDEVKDEVLGMISLKLGVSGKFYELGSSEDCLQGNRKVVFVLHEEFLRLEKDLESSGIEILIPEVKIDDDDEVPKLIPIVSNGTEREGASEVIMEGCEVDLEGVSATNSKKKKKKEKKGNKGLIGGKKKATKKKNGLSENCLTIEESENMVTADGDSPSTGPDNDGNLITFNESVISNLQMQFEKVAAEVGMDTDEISSFDSTVVTMKCTALKKRKRAKSKDRKGSSNPDLTSQADTGGDSALKSVDKSAKKVRFSMKNNLVWKPHSPMPPQSLRLPPSVTPRGSALKKGIPPGPIREMPPAKKKVKQKKKVRKVMKTVSPAIKRLRKLHALSV